MLRRSGSLLKDKLGNMCLRLQGELRLRKQRAKMEPYLGTAPDELLSTVPLRYAGRQPELAACTQLAAQISIG